MIEVKQRLKRIKSRNKFGFLLANTLMILAFIVSFCTKRDCPDSVIPKPIINHVTIKESDFMDAQVSTNTRDVNRGSYEVLLAGAWTYSGNLIFDRGFFKFNYSAIPKGSKITKAILTLYADTTHHYKGHNDNISSFNGSNAWVLRRVNSFWGLNDITWNTQPASDASTEILLPSSTSYKQTYIIDITNHVRDEFKNPAMAYGFVIQLKSEVPYGNVVFGSSDNLDSTVRPKLDIEYTN